MNTQSPAVSRTLAPLALAVASAILVAGCFGSPPAQARLVLGTTTSVNDSGLLNFLLADFESKNNAHVAVVAVGSGQALELGKRGDVDVLIVHSPSQEIAYLANGSGITRWQIMYNYFAIVGPASDPAGTHNASNATDAFKRIAANASVFVSRGDGSGTHTKELQLWAAGGLNASSLPASWYKSIGQGMAAALQTAFEFGGYTLTDEGTYWSQVSIGPSVPSGLHILLGGLASPTSDLKNTYSAIQLNATRVPSINATLATAFALWVTSPETAARIGNYTAAGHQLFFPDPRRI
jgi:tungstate transport system substrate-binding protein